MDIYMLSKDKLVLNQANEHWFGILSGSQYSKSAWFSFGFILKLPFGCNSNGLVMWKKSDLCEEIGFYKINYYTWYNFAADLSDQ